MQQMATSATSPASACSAHSTSLHQAARSSQNYYTRTSGEDFQFAASTESRSRDCELDFSKWFVGFGRWSPTPNPALTRAPQEFACVTVCILCGGIAERGRVLPFMVFTFIWLTLVYCPLAMWAWGTNGWGFSWGVLDYAGMFPYFLRVQTLILAQ